MIRDHAQFEAALDEATGLLAGPHSDGSPAHEHMLSLMQDIAAYRPSVTLKAAEDEEAGRLSSRLNAFQASLPHPFNRHWESMIGGDLSPPAHP